MASGELKCGDKLPSVRALGMQLSINPNTVSKAYAELNSLGLLDSRQGLGLYISAPKLLLSRSERNRRLTQAVQRCVNDVLHLHFSDEEIQKAMKTCLLNVRSVPIAEGQK